MPTQDLRHPSSSPGAPLARAIMAATVALATLGGCSASDPASGLVAPQPSGSVLTHCRAVMAALPETVFGHSRQRHEATLATWGEPGISLRCGVDQPEKLTRTSRCDELGGVGWFAEDPGTAVDKAWRFTTIGRSGFVEVIVPEEYRPAGDALMDLAAAVSRMPLVTACR